MRHSVAPHRASSAMQGGFSAALSKLVEKKKEYDAVSALERASALYLERIEGLGEEFDIMANAGEGDCLYCLTITHTNSIFQSMVKFLRSGLKCSTFSANFVSYSND